jgi:hypothetical protein
MGIVSHGLLLCHASLLPTPTCQPLVSGYCATEPPRCHRLEAGYCCVVDSVVHV